MMSAFKRDLIQNESGEIIQYDFTTLKVHKNKFKNSKSKQQQQQQKESLTGSWISSGATIENALALVAVDVDGGAISPTAVFFLPPPLLPPLLLPLLLPSISRKLLIEMKPSRSVSKHSNKSVAFK